MKVETIFDVHQHYGAHIAQKGGAEGAIFRPEEDAARRVGVMERNGIHQACLQPAHSYQRERGVADLTVLNEGVARLRDFDREHFPVALGTIDLCLGDAAIERETRRALDDFALDGLAWHHRLQGVYVDDPRMDSVLDALAERQKLAAIHLFADSTFEAPWRLENLAERHRDLQFLVLDGFSSFDRAGWMARIATHHPNVVFDTAALTSVAGVLPRFLAEAGADRLLLGTNLYSSHQSDYYPLALHLLRASTTIREHDRHKIFAVNARKLFGLA